MPDSDLKQHAKNVLDKLQNHIKETGPMSFFDYMQFVLYEPGLGYYSAGMQKFGASGDFVTAPEMTPLFSYTLGKQCKAILAEIPSGDILEFGAGSGQMAADILCYLKEHEALPEHYYILEVSPDLIEKQKEKLEKALPNYFEHIIWLDKLPKTFDGIMLANEILDAMPVHHFEYNNKQLKEIFVALESDKLVFTKEKPSKILQQAFTQLKTEVDLSTWETPYQSEINTYIPSWINNIANCLNKGVILLIDYGYPKHEYYHPQRNMGTLTCNYQHQAHSDPLIHCGLQDITSHVDFSLVTESAVNADLAFEGYTTQSSFLINCGIQNFLENIEDEKEKVNAASNIKKLIMPNQMGESFKVIAFSKQYDKTLIGFRENDLSESL